MYSGYTGQDYANVFYFDVRKDSPPTHHQRLANFPIQFRINGFQFVLYLSQLQDPTKHIFYNRKVATVTVANQARQALICEFSWKPKFTVSQFPSNVKQDFNLAEDSFYIIAAHGNAGDSAVGDCKLSPWESMGSIL